MFIVRIIFGLWGIIVIFGAIESALEFVSGGEAPRPISYQSWNQKLFHGTKTTPTKAK